MKEQRHGDVAELDALPAEVAALKRLPGRTMMPHVRGPDARRFCAANGLVNHRLTSLAAMTGFESQGEEHAKGAYETFADTSVPNFVKRAGKAGERLFCACGHSN